MSNERLYRTEGIVLRGLDLGEADRILTLYTPDRGQLRVVAKGIRKTKSRKAGHLDLFTRSSLFVARGRQLDIVTQAETIESFRPIREDLLRSSYCHYAAELLLGFTAENLSNYPAYVLAVTAFRRLATAPDLELVARAFELQLLGITGFRPQLHRCLECGETVKPAANVFSVRLGGVLCPECAGLDRTAVPISTSALKVLRNLQSNEDAMLRVSGLDGEVHEEVERRLQEYIVYRLESRPRSITVLERLRQESKPAPASK
jgi:DNA repair protein RecO (recombination protein O)